jgi:segregation and condensation protein A
MPFSVEHEEFSGPLGLLLELIDRQRLPIARVSMAKVADDFLTYIETNDVPSHELADFLLIASRLIYLKSRELMPYLHLGEEDAAAAKLEDQLRLYQEFLAVAAKLEERYGAQAMYRRDGKGKSMEMKEARFVPPKNISPSVLHDAYQSVLRRLEPFFALQHTSMERAVSVEERMDELKAALESRANLRFRDVIAHAGSRVDIVVSFLALLELLRRRHIMVSQEHHEADIMVKRV